MKSAPRPCPPPATRVLAVIPPMTQLNTPYPSTAYLTGFLRSRGIAAAREDLALALVLELLSAPAWRALRAEVDAAPTQRRSARVQAFVDQFERFERRWTRWAFLQGRDATLMHRIAARGLAARGRSASPR